MNTMNEEALDAVTGGAMSWEVLFSKTNCADCANNKNGQICPHLAEEAAKAAQAAKNSQDYHCYHRRAASSACLV